MQFFWKYIDDLMGKGLEVVVILELLFYLSASVIPLALPLAILLSSIMTFGNLAENNELTALKSSGLSLFRIMRPLTMMVLIIATVTFYFANYVIPVANLKMHALIFDIQDTKVSAILTPGSYSKELDGYAIKVDKGTDNTFEGITIHDFTDPKIVKTIKAKTGTIYKSTDGKFLFFKMQQGRISEELDAQPPIFQTNGQSHHVGGNFRPGRRTSFDVATYKMDLSGFDLNRSDQDMFRNDFEMLNVFQLSEAQDSIQREIEKTETGFTTSIKNDHPFFMAQAYRPDSILNQNLLVVIDKANIPKKAISMDTMAKNLRIVAMNSAIVKIRRQTQNLDAQNKYYEAQNVHWDDFSIEFHRKFALAVTIIVLFFIGAPLGAIVKKGGFGAPVVIAALLFMIYFVLISVGESLAKSGVFTPFWGMWMPSVILTPVAFLLMTSAANDLSLFDKKFWRLIYSFGRKR